MKTFLIYFDILQNKRRVLSTIFTPLGAQQSLCFFMAKIDVAQGDNSEKADV